MENGTVRGAWYTLTGTDIQEIGKMEKNMELENIYTQMVQFRKENLIMENLLTEGQLFFQIRTNNYLKVKYYEDLYLIYRYLENKEILFWGNQI